MAKIRTNASHTFCSSRTFTKYRMTMLAIMSEMRTGSTFVSEALSHALGHSTFIYMLEKDWMSSDDAVVDKCNLGVVKLHHGNFYMVEGMLNKGVKLIVTVRDPLDAYLSATHHLALREDRSFVNALDLMEKREWLSKMSGRMLSFIENRHSNIELVVYERLIDYPFSILSKALDSLEIGYNPVRLKDSCRMFGFRRKTGRDIGEERLGVHERNGSVGQWKTCNVQEILTKSVLSMEYHRSVISL